MKQSKLVDLMNGFRSTGISSNDKIQSVNYSGINCEDGFCIVGDCTCECEYVGGMPKELAYN